MREIGNPTPDLPDDPAALRALLLAAWAERDSVTSERDSLSAERDSVTSERDSLTAERDALAARNERLQHLLQKLQRMQFGRRSERLPEDQLQFAFEEVEASLADDRGRGGEALARPAQEEHRPPPGQAAAGCRRTCRASSRCCCPRAPPAPAARARWSRSAATPPSGST